MYTNVTFVENQSYNNERIEQDFWAGDHYITSGYYVLTRNRYAKYENKKY